MKFKIGDEVEVCNINTIGWNGCRIKIDEIKDIEHSNGNKYRMIWGPPIYQTEEHKRIWPNEGMLRWNFREENFRHVIRKPLKIKDLLNA